MTNEKACDMPDFMNIDNVLYRRLNDGEEHIEGDIPVDGSQTHRFGSIWYRPVEETPEQRDARVTATFKKYCKTGGPVKIEQLTDEMRECSRYRLFLQYWTYYTADGSYVYNRGLRRLVITNEYPSILNLENKQAFWTQAGAKHDQFIRTWKGPLTPESAKNLYKKDMVFVATVCDTVSHMPFDETQASWYNEGCVFINEEEAKTAARNLWMVERSR